ncbi:MAG TPA: restriction endonuclease subunit R [Acidobacteria bacterium]|nr:restriction endonuclease subunit R [Acidobacteriota bacterium]
MNPFAFLQAEWPDVFEAATRAAGNAHPDPRTACFYARRALELAVAWLYTADGALRMPYQNNLSALIHEPTFKATVGEAVFGKVRVIINLGNQAVHSHKPVPPGDALTAVRELFHVAYWMARTYARGERPAPGVTFDPGVLPRTAPLSKQTVEQLRTLESELRDRDEKLSALRADRDSLDDKVKQLRAEVAAAKKASAAQPDTHDYSEAETRNVLIDILLREVGWLLSQKRDREYPLQGGGFADYVLWSDDGRPLAVIEAKRVRKSAQNGQQQAKLYADALEKEFGQRPILFFSNGMDHWLWDDTFDPPRPVQGFLKKSELELRIQRRTSRRPLAEATIHEAIVERPYQIRAIRRVAEAFERDNERKALLVMATGAGKTRTVIALCDLLMRTGWVKRVLFLADRNALVKQAVGAFKKHLPDAAPVNLVEERDAEGRVFVSTYPTMMGLIDEMSEGRRRFGVGHFDLIVIDEAHRSIYQKYRAIFNYFDARLVGLTATPKDEIDLNTYRFFDLERGVPTDVYGLDEAVRDGYLVPAKAISVPIKFQRGGIRYDQLSEIEKEQWDALDWGDDGETPDHVEPEVVNRWLFNKDTVDKVLEHLMLRGQRVEGGDRLGKTIVFAKNKRHAEFIAERFNANYPHYKGAFAQVIHSEMANAQQAIDDFSVPAKAPHIAISVDMLDTGVDVPEVVNLVFFKLVRSRTKFWQMVGRGTRLCKDLFGPGKHKEFFYILDYCQNFEFFGQNPEITDGALPVSLGENLFRKRLELLGELDERNEGAVAEAVAEYGDPVNAAQLRSSLAHLLHGQVAAMNLDNFVVRPKRQWVEKYAQPGAWRHLTAEDRAELAEEVAGLPTAQEPEDESAKRFDLLLLRLQLAVLRQPASFPRLRDQVIALAGLLEEKAHIPGLRDHGLLLQQIQEDDFWQDVTAPMLETVRRRLRNWVKLIDRTSRVPLYTDFEDERGEETEVDLGFGPPDGFERFRAKARAFLREHADHITIRKLRMNRQLTESDLAELERILTESGAGDADEVQKAKEESHGLGLFVRSLVGLDREAAKLAFARFLMRTTLTANQIEFVNLIIDHLTEHGVMAADLLYESPFTDLAPKGPEGLFTSAQVGELLDVLDRVRAAALAA